MIKLPAGARIHPDEDTLLVQIYVENERIEGSIIIKPEQSQGEAYFASVVEVGVGRLIDIKQDANGEPVAYRRPMGVEPGELVVFEKFKGERIVVGEKAYLLLRKDEIIAKIEVSKSELSKYYKLCGKDDMPNDSKTMTGY